MATVTRPEPDQPISSSGWYRASAEEAVARLGVDPAVGQSTQQASALVAAHGTNALPAEKPTPEAGPSIGLSAFALMLIVGAYERQGISRYILRHETFDNRRMNWTALAELALAVLITQSELFNRLLKTTPLTSPQFALALASAVLLIVLWEVGKLIARRQKATEPALASGTPSPAAATS